MGIRKLFKLFTFGIVLLLPFQNASAQSDKAIDIVVANIYNLDFNDVPSQIASIRKNNPRIASYLKIDYLWWKMVSNSSISHETDFIAFMKSFKEKYSGPDNDFERLTYLIYQTRYDNFKKQNLSRYLAALRLHLFIGKMDEKRVEKLSSLEKSIFRMTMEFEKYMMYKYLDSYGILSKKNAQHYQLCLRNIEKMHNDHFASFEIIKTYLLGKIYFEIENDYEKAFGKFGKLSSDFPNNTVFYSLKNDCKAQFVLNSK